MRRLARWLCAGGAGVAVGCSATGPLPAGHLPPPSVPPDAATSAVLSAAGPPRVASAPPAPADGGKKPFDLPATLPGADAPAVVAPRFDKDTPADERVRKVVAAYPALDPVPAVVPADRPPVSLAAVSELAYANSPAVRQAEADADASYGQVIQQGLHPNPTFGYQADQVQPGVKLPPGSGGNGAGQQGVYVNQLIKTAGKLTLQQQVAGYDYVNAVVAVRRARTDVTAAVRTAFFAALVAQESLAVNRSAAALADEVYGLQLRQVAAGQAAGYEPLQLHAQAVLARNAVATATASYTAAWKQLAAATGQRDLPLGTLDGRADAPPPRFDADALRARVLDEHTDVLTARNTIAQAQRYLTLQRQLPIPDLQTNTYQQYDNAAQAYQFGLQIGISLPVSDRNQGNVRTAYHRLVSAGHALNTTQNTLSGRLAEAFGRYESNRVVAANYREKVLPSLTQAYRAVVRRYQVEPDKVQFNDVVVAQQSLVTALQAYLTALGGQWQAVVDVANVAQLDELYPPAPAAVPPPSPSPDLLPPVVLPPK